MKCECKCDPRYPDNDCLLGWIFVHKKVESRNIIGRHRTVSHPQLEGQVLHIINQHPEASIERNAQQVNVCQKMTILFAIVSRSF